MRGLRYVIPYQIGDAGQIRATLCPGRIDLKSTLNSPHLPHRPLTLKDAFRG